MAEKRILPLPPYLRFLLDVPSVANAEITSQETLMALDKDKDKKDKKKVPGNKDQGPETPSEPPEDPNDGSTLADFAQFMNQLRKESGYEPTEDDKSKYAKSILERVQEDIKLMESQNPEEYKKIVEELKRTPGNFSYEEPKTTEIEVEVKEEEGKVPEIKYTVGEQGSFMDELERSYELNKKVKDAEAMLEYFESRNMDQEAKKMRKEINEFKIKNNI
jgi:hypothetical protein